MNPFYAGAVLDGSKLVDAPAGTTVVIHDPDLNDRFRTKLRNGEWYYHDYKDQGPLSDGVPYLIIGEPESLEGRDPVEELAQELYRATNQGVTLTLDEVWDAERYRTIASLVLLHFDHKIYGPVDLPAEPTEVRDAEGDVWTKRENGLWSINLPEGFTTLEEIERYDGPITVIR